MGNWLDKLLGRGPLPYEPASPRVKFIEEFDNSHESTMPIVVVPPRQQYIIKSDGEYSVYLSKSEMTPELREQIERIENLDKLSSSYTVIVNGKRQVYGRFEDIPTEIRTAIEAAQD